MDHHPKKEDIQRLYQAFLLLESEEECQDFLADICTKKEVEAMAARLAASHLLLEGKTYEQIIKTTAISSATLARVSTCVNYGKGYRFIYKKQKDRR